MFYYFKFLFISFTFLLKWLNTFVWRRHKRRSNFVESIFKYFTYSPGIDVSCHYSSDMSNSAKDINVFYLHVPLARANNPQLQWFCSEGNQTSFRYESRYVFPITTTTVNFSALTDPYYLLLFERREKWNQHYNEIYNSPSINTLIDIGSNAN